MFRLSTWNDNRRNNKIEQHTVRDRAEHGTSQGLARMGAHD